MQKVYLVLSILSVALGMTSQVAAGGLVLPKVRPEPTKLLVLDVLDDWDTRKVQQNDAQSALLAITCIQGLVNRSSSEKIYLIHTPRRLFWTVPLPYDSPSYALADGLVPYPVEKVELDRSKPYPALTWLALRYRQLIKGKVLIPEAKGKWNSPWRAAAVNMCTFESILPLTRKLDGYFQKLGVKLELKEDLTRQKQDQLAAFDWSARRYLNHPQRNRQLVGYMGDIGTNPPMMTDYFVATGTFVYFLTSEDKHKADPIDSKYDLLTDKKVYPPATVHIGPVEGGNVIQRIQRRGHVCVCGFQTNASVTSAIPLEKARFKPHEAKAHPIDRNGVYIANLISDDGDALDVVSGSIYGRMHDDPWLGKLPGGTWVNPYLIDTFPTLFAWFSEKVEIVTSMNDGGASYTKEGQAAWVRNYQRYIAATNGSIRLINFFGGAKPFVTALKPLYIACGYLGSANPCRWGIKDGCIYSNFVSPSGGLNMHQSIMRVISMSDKPGEPIFIVTRAKDEPSEIVAWLDKVRNDARLRRNLYVLKLGDIALTWKEWQSLRNSAKPSLKAIRTALQSSDVKVRENALWDLASLPEWPADMTGQLLQFLTTGPDPVKIAAAGVLCNAKQQTQQITRIAVDQLEHSSNIILKRQLLTLISKLKCADATMVARIMPLLHDPAVGILAADVIGKNVTSLPAELPALLQAKEERLVHCAAIILARCPEKRPALMPIMVQAFRRVRKSDTRQALIKAWSTFGHHAEAAMPILLEIIANPKKYPYGEVIGACRSAAVIAAESSQDFPQLVTLLTQRLRSAPHYSIKQVAAEALGKLGKKARPAIPALIVLLRKDVHYMQSWAAYALTRIDATDPRVKEVLSWYAKHGKWVKLRQRLKDYLAGKNNALVTQ